MKQSKPETMLQQIKTHRFLLLYLLTFALYIAARLLHASAVFDFEMFPDSWGYLEIAKKDLTDPVFWTGIRPFTIPLAYKLVEGDGDSIVWLHLIFSIFSWGLLALFVSRTLSNHWVKLIAFAGILLFSLSDNIIVWDFIILSESITLSLMACLIAMWLWLLEGWRWYKALLVMLTGILWVFTRDTNAWSLMLVGVTVAGFVVIRKLPLRYLLITLVFVGTFFLSNRSADMGNRWELSFTNVIGRYILPQQEHIDFLAEQGMPVTDALLDRAGKLGWEDDWAFFENPELDPWRDWMVTEGKGSYMRWLIFTVFDRIGETALEWDQYLSFGNLKDYASEEYQSLLPEWLSLAHLWTKLQVVVWLVIIAVSIVISRKHYWRKSAWYVPLVMLLLVYPQVFIIWYGDPNEIPRHTLTVALQFSISGLMLLFFAVDSLVQRNFDRHQAKHLIVTNNDG